MDKLVKYLCIIQARTNSSRLPAKVMLDLDGKTLIERVIETVSKSELISKVIVATSDEIADDIIALKLLSNTIDVYRGSLTNVLSRFYNASKRYNAVNIVRVTADNPFMDSKVIDDLIKVYEEKNCDYSMFLNAVYGLSAEVFSFKSLEEANKLARNDFDKEHVTPYIRDKKNIYVEDIQLRYKKPEIRATIDTFEDYVKMQKFFLYCSREKIEANIDNFITYCEVNEK